jgi:hypothetical protein
MRRTINILALAVAMAAFAVPVLAQTKECNDENKGAWYKTFYDNFKGDPAQQKTAYDAAKTYIAACPADPNDQQRPYMEKWVKKYDDVMQKAELLNNFKKAADSKNYGEEMRFGKQILATDPDNPGIPGITILLGSAGLGDPNLMAESAQYAKKSIEMIEAGKPFAPFTSKDQALAYLNYVMAKHTVKSDPTAAIPYFVKAARYESDLKKNPLLYNELAAAYGEGPVAKLTEDFKGIVGKSVSVDSPEYKLVIANLNQAIDRQIDAFARAAALSTNPADKKAIMDVLTGLYKDRNKSATDANVNELVAKVLSTPVPDAPTPITSLPASSTSTPATTGGTNGTGNGGTNNGNGKPAANNMTTSNTGTGASKTGSTTGTTTGGSAKPAASPTPMNKKPRLNYRRG